LSCGLVQLQPCAAVRQNTQHGAFGSACKHAHSSSTSAASNEDQAPQGRTVRTQACSLTTAAYKRIQKSPPMK
jgi:hypothetical protein